MIQRPFSRQQQPSGKEDSNAEGIPPWRYDSNAEGVLQYSRGSRSAPSVSNQPAACEPCKGSTTQRLNMAINPKRIARRSGLDISREPAEFILKTFLPMMFFLIGDVCTQLGYVSWADRKRPVTILPIKVTKLRLLCFDPFRRIAFQFTQQIGNRSLLAQATKQMHMVLDTANHGRRQSEFRKMPAKYACVLARNSASLGNGWRCFVEKTICT